jgi:hypothetical protein
MYYSPVRRSPPGCPALPLDLHVLGLPPAFNLSHDQTLQLFRALQSLPTSREDLAPKGVHFMSQLRNQNLLIFRRDASNNNARFTLTPHR